MKPRPTFAALCALLGGSNLFGQLAPSPTVPPPAVSISDAAQAAIAAAVAAAAERIGYGDGSVTTVTVASIGPIDPPPRIVPPPAPYSANARITNLSTRARVGGDSPLITGFGLAGSGLRTILVRAVGPTLGEFGVADSVAAPHLILHDATGAILLENSGWSGNPLLVPATVAAGAFPLTAGSADSAIVVTLPAGTYSVEVGDDAHRGGVVLTEIYDVNGTAEGARLTNVSTRNNVAPAGGEFISGFIVSGTMSAQYLVRGVGPGLERFGVNGVLRDPALTLFNTSGTPIATNDDWSGPRVASATVSAVVSGGSGSSSAAVQGAAQAVTTTTAVAGATTQVAAVAVAAATANPIALAATRAGAFGLDNGSYDAALLVTLTPGIYTVQLNASAASGANPTSGTALLEIYELP